MTKSVRFLTSAVALVALSGAPRAFAVSKEIVQLQTQVQQLQDAVAKLQQTDDERLAVLKTLIGQTSDTVTKMSTGLDAIQQSVAKQQEADGAKLDQVSGQIQSLNDSLDELRARLAKLDKSVTDIQSSEQSINATLQQNAPQTGPQTGGTQAGSQPGTQPGSTPGGQPGLQSGAMPVGQPGSQPPDGQQAMGAASGQPAAQASAPPAEQLYQTAFGDYNAAKYTLSSAEFHDVIHYYPDNALAGNSYFYLGEIDYRQGKFAAAVKNYDAVLQKFVGNNKVPASELRKGQCLLSLKEKDAGVREFRALIQRYPNSPEAAAARTRLNAMGITIVPRATR